MLSWTWVSAYKVPLGHWSKYVLQTGFIFIYLFIHFSILTEHRKGAVVWRITMEQKQLIIFFPFLVSFGDAGGCFSLPPVAPELRKMQLLS